MTALYLAVDKGHVDIVRLLLEKGANIEAVNNVSNRTCMPVCLSICLPIYILILVIASVIVLYVHACVYLHYVFITTTILMTLCLFFLSLYSDRYIIICLYCSILYCTLLNFYGCMYVGGCCC